MQFSAIMICPKPTQNPDVLCTPNPAASSATKKQTEAFKIALHRDDGKENGKYRNYRDYIGYILGLYWDKRKENGSYCSILGLSLSLSKAKSASRMDHLSAAPFNQGETRVVQDFRFCARGCNVRQRVVLP